MSDAIIAKLHDRFDAQAAQGMDEVFQFHFSDAGDHHLVVKNGTLAIRQGEHEEPSVSLSMHSDTLKKMMSGELNGMTAFMSGKFKATGNVMLATQLTRLFPGD